jgi:hypothetical protein
MDIQTAIEIVEYHQSWRLGEKEEMLYEPRVITEAINVLLAEVKKTKPPTMAKRGLRLNEKPKSF